MIAELPSSEAPRAHGQSAPAAEVQPPAPSTADAALATAVGAAAKVSASAPGDGFGAADGALAQPPKSSGDVAESDEPAVGEDGRRSRRGRGRGRRTFGLEGKRRLSRRLSDPFREREHEPAPYE